MQISNYANADELATLKVNFTNNNVVSANGVVYFYHNLNNIALDVFKGVLNFSGNTYAKDVDKIADRGQYTDAHVLYDQANKDALAGLIK